VTSGGLWHMLLPDANEFSISRYLLEHLNELGIDVVRLAGHRQEDMIATGAMCDGIFVYRAAVDRAVLDGMPHCRVVSRIGTGYERIDVAECANRGIGVTYVPSFCDEEMANHAIMGVLALAKQIPLIAHAAKDRRWLRIDQLAWPRRLSCCSLGILGFGRSGQLTAQRAAALGLDVVVWTRTPRPGLLRDAGARAGTLDDALACDFVSIHLPSTPETRRLIGPAALGRMRPGAGLINIARGDIVDTDALVDALRSGHLGGAVLDVVDPEPLPAEHPLWDIPSALLTCHTASLSREAMEEAQLSAFDDAAAVLAGRAPRHPVPELANASSSGDRVQRRLRTRES
jgi:phosphoglycerate dehydrogenase-like enzyme